MTDDEAEALGRRAIAAGMPWHAGMIDGGGGEQALDPEDGDRVRWEHPVGAPSLARRWPDLRDAATRGAALEALRERMGEPGLYVMPVDYQPVAWAVCRHAGSGESERIAPDDGPSEGAAIIVAWEAAR